MNFVKFAQEFQLTLTSIMVGLLSITTTGQDFFSIFLFFLRFCLMIKFMCSTAATK